MGGGWHYAVDRFIHRHWPDMAEKLRAMPEVEQVIVSMLAPHRDTVTWPTVLAEHASIALKCALSRQESESESVHRRFAQARGLVLFPWFDEWIRNLTSQSANFVNAFEALPEKIEQEYTSLVEIADISHSGPPTINMALASGQGHATIVIPDNWEQTAFDAIAKRWEIVTPHVMRETQWREHSEVHNSPVIAFGQASHDELIKSAMMEHQLQLNPSAEGGDLLLALLPVKTAKQPWRLLIAVEDKSVATRFPAEQALDLFHRVARFSSLRFVEGDTPSLSTSS